MGLTKDQLAKIDKLRNMSTARGASAGEQENAITLIGRLVFEHGLNGVSAPREAYDPDYARVLMRLSIAERELTTARIEAREWRAKYERVVQEQRRNPFAQSSQGDAFKTAWEDAFREPFEEPGRTTGNGRVHLRGKEVWVDDCEVLQETNRALLVRLSLPNVEQEWFPKSQIFDESECSHRDDQGTLKVTLWIARQKGIV